MYVCIPTKAQVHEGTPQDVEQRVLRQYNPGEMKTRTTTRGSSDKNNGGGLF